MARYTKEQHDYIIELYYLLCDKNCKLTLNNDLTRLFKERFPEKETTYASLYGVFREIRVNKILFKCSLNTNCTKPLSLFEIVYFLYKIDINHRTNDKGCLGIT